MEEKKSITRNILDDNAKEVEEEEYTDEYYLKKLPVFHLLARILYMVLIVILFLFGVYFISLSNSDNITRDYIEFEIKSREWNKTYYKDFDNWRIYLKNEINQTIALEKSSKKLNEHDESVNFYYDPLQFITSNFSDLLADIKLNKKKKFDNYNLTSNFYLTVFDGVSQHDIELRDIPIFLKTSVSPTPKKSACIKSKSLWSDEEEKCYRLYLLRMLCLIIDQDTKQLFHDYKNFKCNGYNDWYESYGIFHWMIGSYDPSHDDIESLSKNINVYLSTNKNPYVYAQYNGTLQFSNKAQTYGTVGVWLMATAILLVLVPVFIIYKNKKNEVRATPDYANVNKSVSNYFNLSGDESKLEMTDIRQTTKEESFKNVAKRI